MKIETEKLIELYNESKIKAQICLGFDYDVDLLNNDDDSRQVISLVTKELNDCLFVYDAELFEVNIERELILNNCEQLIKILDVLNYFNI